MVTGSVTSNGEPLSSALVNFFPEGGGRALGGPLGSDGKFSISLPPGEYRVVVLESAPSVPDDWREGDPVPAAPIRVHPRYSQAKSTSLRLTMPESGKTVQQDFEVGK